MAVSILKSVITTAVLRVEKNAINISSQLTSAAEDEEEENVCEEYQYHLPPPPPPPS